MYFYEGDGFMDVGLSNDVVLGKYVMAVAIADADLQPSPCHGT